MRRNERHARHRVPSASAYRDQFRDAEGRRDGLARRNRPPRKRSSRYAAAIRVLTRRAADMISRLSGVRQSRASEQETIYDGS